MSKRTFSAYIIMIVGLMFFACSRPHSDESLIQELRHSNFSNDSLTEKSIEDFTDLNNILVNLPEFEEVYIQERTRIIQSFPCLNCHNESLDKLQAKTNPNEKNAHWDIQLVHATLDVMDCNTCHDKSNLNQLITLSEKPLDLNSSYAMCGQCHSTQFNDWKGGAHGKRVGGWAPPKVIFSCVECHNPHKPAFESRWPARLNTEKLKQISGN